MLSWQLKIFTNILGTLEICQFQNEPDESATSKTSMRSSYSTTRPASSLEKEVGVRELPEPLSNVVVSSLLRAMARILVEEAERLEKLEIQDQVPNFYKDVRNFECSLIERALSMTSGSQLRAARMLGMKKTTLNSKIKIYNISVKKFVLPQHSSSLDVRNIAPLKS